VQIGVGLVVYIGSPNKVLPNRLGLLVVVVISVGVVGG